MNWLIAEDETDIRNLVSMMTTVWGHTPMTFENGQKVWDWMDKIEMGEISGPFPDFALMDIRMPGKRGNEIALRMRTVEQLKNIPVVLMTAFALGDDEMQRMRTEYAVDHIINKPLPDFDKLRTMLHDIINRKKTELATAKPVETKPAEPKPTEAAPHVETKPIEAKPAEAPSTEVKPTGAGTEPAKPGSEASGGDVKG